MASCSKVGSCFIFLYIATIAFNRGFVVVTNLKMDFKIANTMVNGDNNNVIVLKTTVVTRTLTQKFKGTIIYS